MLTGSLALLADLNKKTFHGSEPEIELHFNLWYDLPHERSALDIGFRISNANQFEELVFFVPDDIGIGLVTDLFDCLKDKDTLSAIFNMVLGISDSEQRSFSAESKPDVVEFSVLSVAIGTDLIIDHCNIGGNRKGTQFQFKKCLFDRAKDGGDTYFRIRIELKDRLKFIFKNEYDSLDKNLLSTFYRKDVIEFRLNESRNIPSFLRERLSKGSYKIPKIATIHFILARGMESELITTHSDFRKMRRLEDGMWDLYLKDYGKQASQHKALYHWRAINKERGIEDFILMCVFRSAKSNIFWYLLYVVGFGALGSAMQSIFTSIAKKELDGTHLVNSDVCIQGIVIGVILILLLFLWYVFRVITRREASECTKFEKRWRRWCCILFK